MPNKFLINSGFGFQMKLNASEDLSGEDEYGYLNIPDEYHFYLMMSETNLYMVNARRNDLATTHLSIDFK